MNEENKEESGYSFFTRIDTELEKTVSDIEDYYKNNFNDPEQYLQTGFEKLNLRKGDLIILASRPCLGRFSFAMSIVNNVAMKNKKPVGCFSCGDRDASSICKQLISIRTGIPLSKILRGYLKVEDVKKISKESGNLYGSKIYINDTPNIMYEEFELAADLMVNKLRVELIIIDSYEYLQEIVQSDDEDIFCLHSTILNKYKEKARELNIPIIVLMELPIRNEDEPSIADFRKKMAIPRNVDEVFFLDRERIKDDRKTCEANLIMGKNSHGVNLYIPLTYHTEKRIYTNYLEEK